MLGAAVAESAIERLSRLNIGGADNEERPRYGQRNGWK